MASYLWSVICKAMGIACILTATAMLCYSLPGSTTAGYALIVPLAVAVYGLGLVALFGARFGTLIYTLTGLAFICAGAMQFLAFFISALFLEYGRGTSAFISLFLPFIFMAALVLAGIMIIQIGREHGEDRKRIEASREPKP